MEIERRGGVEERVRHLERTVFGYVAQDDNRFIDGLLQIAADTRTLMEKNAVRGKLNDKRMFLFAVVTITLLAAITTHQYGLIELIAKVI